MNMSKFLDFDFNNIQFVKTNDGSVGLYNSMVNDIYHSSFGAKKEAIEKFINPLNFSQNFNKKTQLKILDICFGVGYNTKAFLKKIIDTNYNGKIIIDALEYDDKLVLISPFINDMYFSHYPQISYLLIRELYEQLINTNKNILDILYNHDNKPFFNPFYRNLLKNFYNNGYKHNQTKLKNSILHNIYYHCISQRMKYNSKILKKGHFTFTPYFEDARLSIKRLNPGYDIVFLDAFTPAKLPTLWSIHFLHEIYNKISDNGILVTYSNSSAVRHALCNLGFHVGKVFDNSMRPSGSIATKNKELIKYPLNKYDLGLMKTNAGVYFKDPELNLDGSIILENWQNEKNILKLPSSSQYIKRFKKESFDA